jgi:hypothetical protein
MAESHPCGREAVDAIQFGIDVPAHFVHFKGEFLGVAYDDPMPPPRIFPNPPSLRPFHAFISRSFLKDLASGAAFVWGRVGTHHPPRCVLPLGIEPEKPRLILNEKYLCCWHPPYPFSLPALGELPQWVGDLIFSIDFAAWYKHFRVTPRSLTFTSCAFLGFYISFPVLTFGWSLAPFYSWLLGSIPAMFLRRQLGLPGAIFHDDAAGSEIPGRPCGALCAAKDAVFVTCVVWIAVGAIPQLSKCVLVPTTCLPTYLGMEIRLLPPRGFAVPPDKWSELRRLTAAAVSSLPRGPTLLESEVLAGKLVSVRWALPSVLLFCRFQFAAIAAAVKNGVPPEGAVPVSEGYVEELRALLTILQGPPAFAPFLRSFHVVLNASLRDTDSRWHFHLLTNGEEYHLPVLPAGNRFSQNIARSLTAAIGVFGDLGLLAGARLDVTVDDLQLVAAFNDLSGAPVSGSLVTLESLRTLAQTQDRYGFNLSLTPSAPPISPERRRSATPFLEASVNDTLWQTLEHRFGPHSLDWAATQVNTKCRFFFSRDPCPFSAGVNFLVQDVTHLPGSRLRANGWAFPPFPLVPATVAFAIDQKATVTLLLPDIRDGKHDLWWPHLISMADEYFRVGRAGSLSVAGLGPAASPFPVAYDMWVFRLSFE